MGTKRTKKFSVHIPEIKPKAKMPKVKPAKQDNSPKSNPPNPSVIQKNPEDTAM